MEPIFEAVLKGEEEVTRLLRADPAVARARASRDHLVEAIPHWLYAGDTALHLAAAGLWSGVARALLDAGFVIRGVHDAITLRPPAGCEPRLLVVAQKPVNGQLKSSSNP